MFDCGMVIEARKPGHSISTVATVVRTNKEYVNSREASKNCWCPQVIEVGPKLTIGTLKNRAVTPCQTRHTAYEAMSLSSGC